MKFASKLIHGGQCTFAIDLSSYLRYIGVCRKKEKKKDHQN